MLQIEPGTNGNHAPIGQAQNNGSSANPGLNKNVCPEGTEYQYFTSPSGDDFGRNVHVSRSELIRNSPHQYNPVLGSAR